MLTLINTNMMVPPIGPLGLDYIAGVARYAGYEVEVVDLCLADDPLETLRGYFATHSPQLVGVSFRNVDDSFWPSARWFVPDLSSTIRTIRSMTDTPIVIGGVGFSIFAERILECTAADRQCLYCADPLAKGAKVRLRNPSEVADEVQSLLAKGIDVLHLCDSEFNIPRSHAYALCEEFNRCSFGKRLRWYTYMAVLPFDAELAEAMSKAGCVGIDFTGDSACPLMLKTYRQPHLKEDLASAVRLCRDNGIAVMIDLLFGGPGETPKTVAETIDFIKQIDPDCAGAPLGVRIYPGTEMARIVTNEGSLETNPNIRRKYSGAVDFFKPTFYISASLGERPAELVQDLIAGDKRFFGPMLEAAENNLSTDHNYSDNTELVESINRGARGAYWDILRKLRRD